ncbi:MAG: biosynthetic-type acetolactate synthase large subunit [Armatimonadota bacterium]
MTYQSNGFRNHSPKGRSRQSGFISLFVRYSIMNGGKAVMEVFTEEGVDVFFGYPGGSIIPIYDALYDSEIRSILPRHEQGAVHAADGYARSTGRVGVCMATSGPGATNLVTGLATAYMDSVPMVAITGQVKRHLIGKDSFQEADTTGITLPITKHNYLVTDETDFVNILREAFYLARNGRPGPILVDVPFDVTAGDVPYPERDIQSLDCWEDPRPIDADKIARAAEKIEDAEKPVIMIGGGVVAADACDEVKELAEKLNICVIHTMMAKGCFPETHELSMGMPGMHGMAYASHALQKSDLMIVIGARFDDRITGDLQRFAPEADVIHIDIDAAEIDKIRPANIGICADAKAAVAKLIEGCDSREKTKWEDQLFAWREENPLGYGEPDEGIAPQYVVEQLYELTNGEAIITTEVGQNQMWAAQYYKLDRPRRFCSSGGLGTMGYGFPAAIGAQVGNPDELVVDIAGDGSIQMNVQELTTAAVNKLPVKVVILNNSYLGMVRQWQELFFENRLSGVELTGNPDFVAVAEAFGGAGFRCMETEDVRETLEKGLEIDDRPVFMDFAVTKEENVFPFIPAGQTVDEIMLSHPDKDE